MAHILILLPGLHGTADLFGPLLAAMPPDVRTRIVSHPSDRVCNYAELLRLMEAQLADEREVVLVAESFSGVLALQYAAAHSERVRAVVLCATFVSAPVPGILSYLATPLILARMPIPRVAIRAFLSGFRAPGSLISELKRTLKTVHPRVLAHRVRQAAWIDGHEALRKCAVPLLCLAGTRDRLIGSRSVRRIRRIRPDVTIKRLDGPHLLLQLKHVEVWHEINRFLKSVDAKLASAP